MSNHWIGFVFAITADVANKMGESFLGTRGWNFCSRIFHHMVFGFIETMAADGAFRPMMIFIMDRSIRIDVLVNIVKLSGETLEVIEFARWDISIIVLILLIFRDGFLEDAFIGACAAEIIGGIGLRAGEAKTRRIDFISNFGASIIDDAVTEFIGKSVGFFREISGICSFSGRRIACAFNVIAILIHFIRRIGFVTWNGEQINLRGLTF